MTISPQAEVAWCAKCDDAPRVSANVAYCRTCWNEYQRAYKRKRYQAEAGYRDRIRTDAWLRRYGISENRYTELYAQQGGACAVCLLDDGERMLHVDHDHATGRVRGLPCARCNGALGMLRDRRDLLNRASEYLAIFDN